MKPRSTNLLTILIVEADAPIRDLLQEALGDAGFRVLMAADQGRAVNILCTIRVDCVLADAFLSPLALDPWGALSEIRAVAGETPVVIFTAHERRRFDGYAEQGFAGFVAKPFSLDALDALIRQVVRRGQPALPLAASSRAPEPGGNLPYSTPVAPG
jgi:DNA-binding response OmpR family regulator